MKRRRKFQFIKDTRFSNNPQGEINTMTKQLETNIVDKAILTVMPTKVISLPDNTTSFRKTFIIEKRQGYTWDDLYDIINKIQAPFYEIV